MLIDHTLSSEMLFVPYYTLWKMCGQTNPNITHVMTSWHRKLSTPLAVHEGNTLATGGSSYKRVSMVKLWYLLCCWQGKSVKKQVKLPVIRHGLMLMWLIIEWDDNMGQSFCLDISKKFDSVWQERHNTIDNALELRLSCTNSST